MFADKTVTRKMYEYKDVCRLMRTAFPRMNRYRYGC